MPIITDTKSRNFSFTPIQLKSSGLCPSLHQRLAGKEVTKTAPIASSDISQRLLHLLKTGDYFRPLALFGIKHELFKDIEEISPSKLKQVLDEYFQDLCLLVPFKDLLENVDRLAQALPLEKLQEAIRSQYPNYKDALQTSKNMLHDAKRYLAAIKPRDPPSYGARFSFVVDKLISMIESIINAFGLNDFFKAADSETQADFKSQKIMMLCSLFSLLTSSIIPAIGIATGGLIIGGTLLFIGALSLVYPFIRPTPNYLPKAENWSKQYHQGDLSITDGRQKALDVIAHTLISSKSGKIKTHPLLIGKSGVGKTQTVKSFVQAVENGSYPELKGKRFFYINAANLMNHTPGFLDSGDPLKHLSDAMGRHRENIILIFDEIHLVCQKGKNSVVGEKLKTFLDEGGDSFPYVIGITTEEEYYRDIYINNSAFARRFKRIQIENTDDIETLEILNKSLLQRSPHTLLEKDSLRYLLERTKEVFTNNAPQPATSMKILTQCIKHTTESQKSPIEIKIEKLYAEIVALHSQGSVGQGAALLPYDRNNDDPLHNLEHELAILKEQLLNEKQQLNHLNTSIAGLAKIKRQTYESVLKISSLNQLTHRNEHRIKAFLLLSHFLAPMFEKEVCSKAKELGVTAVIDRNLIEEVIEEEKNNEIKASEAVLKGKNQLEQRTQS